MRQTLIGLSCSAGKRAKDHTTKADWHFVLCHPRQPYSIAPPDMHQNSASHAAMFNLALIASDDVAPGKENNGGGGWGNSGGGSPQSGAEAAGPVFCNALEMRLASTYVQEALDDAKVCPLRLRS